MLVTLSGLDGAGKSTLAEALKDKLASNGISAVVVHMNKQIGFYALLRCLRDGFLNGFRRARASEPPNDDTPRPAAGMKALVLHVRHRIIWNKSLRRCVDLGDLVTFHLYHLYLERVRGQVLIMDRYFYDRLTDVADGRHWRYLRCFALLTPLPDVPVFVEVSPEEAFARKGEFSVDVMTRRNAIYRQVFSWVPGAVILVNDDYNRASEELLQLVWDRRQRLMDPALASSR